MQCLLISGAQSVGKSETIYRLVNRLQGYTIVAGTLPTPDDEFEDFRLVLEGKNNNDVDIRIIINSPTDTENIINDFKYFYDLNGTYDILISSVRDDSFPVREDFFNIMNIRNSNNFILEIPLAKITRYEPNFSIGLNWYERQIDALIDYIINLNPFNIS